MMIEKHARRNTTMLSGANGMGPPTLARPGVLKPSGHMRTGQRIRLLAYMARKSRTRILHSVCELCKPDSGGVCSKDRVHVLEKDVPDHPRGNRDAAEIKFGHSERATYTHPCLSINRAEVHIGGINRPGGATERYGDIDIGGTCCGTRDAR